MSDLHLFDNVIMQPRLLHCAAYYANVCLVVGLLFLSTLSDEGLLLETSA